MSHQTATATGSITVTAALGSTHQRHGVNAEQLFPLHTSFSTTRKTSRIIRTPTSALKLEKSFPHWRRFKLTAVSIALNRKKLPANQKLLCSIYVMVINGVTVLRHFI